MKIISFILSVAILFASTINSANARPGESINSVLKKYNLEGAQPFTKDDYIAYKLNDPKFISQPTVFFQIGAKGIILEQNFLFDKNTFHEKDVQRAKNDTLPTYAIPHQAYLIGDFSQLPREDYSLLDRVAGAAAAPLGGAAGSIVGAGKGAIDGTKLGVNTAGQASRALGGDASGVVGGWAGSATAVATGAITGLFAGLAGGAVEGTARGARVGVEGFEGADRRIKGELALASEHSIVGGRLGKELSLQEQKELLEKLASLENARLAGNSPTDNGNDIAQATDTESSDNSNSYLDKFDTASANNGFDKSPRYAAEDGTGSNVVGMW